MTGMVAVNAEERIRRSGARWGMIAMTSAKGSAGTTHPRAMNSAVIQNRSVDTYDALQSFMLTTVLQPNTHPPPLQFVSPSFRSVQTSYNHSDWSCATVTPSKSREQFLQEVALQETQHSKQRELFTSRVENFNEVGRI